MLERWNRAQRAAIMAYDEPPWSQVLPFVQLDLCTAVCEELAANPAEQLLGENFRLPDNLVLNKRDDLGETGLLRLLREAVPKLNADSAISSQVAGGLHPWGT